MKMRGIWIGCLSAAVLAGCGEKKVEPLREPAPAVSVATPSPSPTPRKTETPPPVIGGEGTPLRVIQWYTQELREMVGLNERKQKGVRDEEKERRVQTKVREFFDFPTLARLSLGNHWKRVTPAQQKQYSALFIELVEDSYIRRSRDLVGNYELTYTGEQITRERAKVTCRVARRDADVDILYELHRKDGKWMIFNIVLDNVDLIRNYQSQFNQIILKRGWGELIKLMQKKLDGGGEEDADV